MKSQDRVFTIILTLFLFSCSSHNFDGAPSDIIQAEDLLEDLLIFEDKMLEDHPMLLNTNQRISFQSKCDLVQNELEYGLNTKEFYIKIARLASSLQCGHTRLSYPKGYWEKVDAAYMHLPLRLYFDGTAIYVREVLSDIGNIPLGVQVLAINGKPAAQIASELLSALPADGLNETYKYFQLTGRWYGIELHNEFYPENYKVQFLLPDSINTTLKVVEIPAGKKEDILYYRNQILGPLDEYEPYSYYRIDSVHMAVLTIRDFVSYSKKEFRDFLNTSFEDLMNNAIYNLVIDLRGNDGGDPAHAGELFSYLISTPTQYFSSFVYGYGDLKKPVVPKDNSFKGNLFVLQDGGSFSTTGHLLSLLKYYKLGVLIGETSGGSYRCYGCYNELTLPNSKLHLMYSRCTFQTAVDGRGMETGVIPDIFVKPGVFDLIDGKDVGMEKIISIFTQDEQDEIGS